MGRFNLEFSDEAEALLDALAKRKDCTKAEVLRRALNLETWMTDKMDAGYNIVLEAPDGSLRQIVLL